MATPVVDLEYDGEVIFSPFTGAPADTPVGPPDDSVLFIHYGDPSVYAVISDRARRIAAEAGVDDAEELSPDELAGRLKVPGVVTFRVDAGWNGTNYYCFAPIVD